MAKLFLLGVGAQKAGTTWLYRYLSQSGQFDFGIMKEYHVWDAAFLDSCHEKRVTEERIQATADLVTRTQLRLRLLMQTDHSLYARYFSSLIKGPVTSTGDITPAYSGLSASQFHAVKARLENDGFTVRVIFLMRDPVRRCGSAALMEQRLRKSTSPAEVILREEYRSKAFQIRTHYHHTVRALEQVFPAQCVYCGIYEELFTPQSIEAISSFCCVPANPHFGRKVFNPSKRSIFINEDLEAEIRHFYSEVYAFCHQRFPQTVSLWSLPSRV